MSGLSDFITQVRDGMAKVSHFTTVITLPESLNRNVQNLDMTKLILFCDQTQLPGISFSTNQVRSYGEFREVPYEKLYEPVTLSFYVDSNMMVKSVFDEWMKLIQGSSRDFVWPETYTTDKISIIVENTQGEAVYQCDLRKCYPKAIAPVQMDYAGRDVMKLQVTLAYQFAETTRIGKATQIQDQFSQSAIDNIMEEYNYGFQSFAKVPTEYFDDFTSFQKQFENFDFSFGGVQSLSSFEDIGVKTGFGGIFI